MRSCATACALVFACVILGSWTAIFFAAADRDDAWQALVARNDASSVALDPAPLARPTPAEERRDIARKSKSAKQKLQAERSVPPRPKFLSSPMLRGRISSRFQASRMHPILNVLRPHYGIDYAAPLGSPVVAVADGVVKAARYSRGPGRMIVLSHGHGYETAYFHLARISARTRSGAKIRMGQVIGYVGSSGLSNGPHLHFELRLHGKQIDPQDLQPDITNVLETTERQKVYRDWVEAKQLKTGWAGFTL